MARKMKDSGVPWIGEIPNTWKSKKLKYVVSYNDDTLGESTNLDFEFDYIDISSVQYGKGLMQLQRMTLNDAPSRARRLVKPNDVIISTVRTYLKAVATIQKHSIPLIASTGFIVLRAKEKEIMPLFLNYAVLSEAFISLVEAKSVGISYPAINASEVVNIAIPMPPLYEQQKIAAFLDAECARVDDVIEKTRASIEEYKKLKQAVITRAVTKGIRPNRAMKDSGNVWFGEIPSNWNMRRVKYIFSIKKNIAGKEGYQVLSITQQGIKPKDISKNEGQLAENYSHYQLVDIGDYAMNHMDLLTGWVDVSKFHGVTSPDYRVFVLNDEKNYSKEYYLYLLQMCYSNRIFYGLGQGVSGMGRWRLKSDKFLNFTVSVPLIEEQKEIADYLDKKCAEIDALIAQKEQLIVEMESYKKSLIYEYVTGKKEVV